MLYIIDKMHLTECGIPHQVNKAFCYSATHLMFQSFVIQLDWEGQAGHFPFIKIEELCCNDNAHYLQAIVIECHDHLYKDAAAQNLGEFTGSYKQFTLHFKQFPSLGCVVLILYKYYHGCHAMEAAD